MAAEASGPGPWEAIKSSHPQCGGDWFVARNISPRPSFSHYEQLRDEDGRMVRFETKGGALDAIAKAAG